VRVYLLKRFLLIPVTLLGITFITFLVMKLAPGDPAQVMRAQAAGGNVQATETNKKAMEKWREERHLDKPLMTQYGYWLWDLVRLDLGRSFLPPREKVSTVILDRMWITIILNLIAFVLIYVIAIPVGILGAARQFTIWDRLTTIIPFILYSLPSFWVGTLMIAYLTGKDSFIARWTGIVLPTTSYYPSSIGEVGFWKWTGEWARHLALPVICETYAGFAFLSRQMRSSLLEQIRQDFVRTARAKGLSERVVILRHATRNALIPMITLFGSLLPFLLAGSVIIEYLFSIPGMGQLFFESVLERDYHMLMGIETVSALLTLLGILISDVLYVVANPTISYE
jgi:peptide/nickel transport system permease protein